MANLFNITTATNSVTLDAQRTGKALFTVSNTSANTVRARARITSPDTTIVPWFTIEGQSGRVMAPAGTEQYTVDIAVPLTAAPKDYTSNLLVVDESNPDENFTEGPAVKVAVLALVPVSSSPKPFPWWIVAVAVVVVILILAGAGVVINQNQIHADQTSTALALACHPSVVSIKGPYNVSYNTSSGPVSFDGIVFVGFSLLQANDQSHHTFPTGEHYSVLGGYPVCTFWSPVEFVCDKGIWVTVSGNPTVGIARTCQRDFPPGVVNVDFR